MLNAVSVGGELRSFTGDDTSAKALIAGWPGDELLDALQLTQGDGDRLWNAFAPIMEHLGIRYGWQREGEAVRMTFEVGRT